ncbi:MAG: Cys-Gln thioester bond-forming surface protein [Oscillospiraceae bacterium]|nr:Cys-Gln thioester bond-forming surface protein [Oscillospiraceae bacterium]
MNAARRAVLLACLTILLCRLGSPCTLAAEANLVFEEDGGIYQFSDSRVTSEKTGPLSTAVLRLVSPYDDSPHLCYGCDAETFVFSASAYTAAPLENCPLLTKETAARIRAVVHSAYPFISLEELAQRAAAALNRDMSSLTEGDAIAAAQAAIWCLSNPHEDGEPAFEYADSKNARGKFAHDPLRAETVNALRDYYLSLESKGAAGSDGAGTVARLAPLAGALSYPLCLRELSASFAAGQEAEALFGIKLYSAGDRKSSQYLVGAPKAESVIEAS